ncbi:MAG TPA: uracil-DNA glycosylase family protein [Planctomycetota bacterium]|nr:uracil-DNA glycosylase family protein [Planctomycetota bacterium]
MIRTKTSISSIEAHLSDVKACQKCPNMIGPVVTPRPVVSKVYLCGQAPGPHEGRIGQPFAWTAGKTLFRWLGEIGVDEETFRSRAFIGAVCRCFPGKTKQGGDRVPGPEEISACSGWMKREIELLRPDLIIAVGRLAINQFLPEAPLAEIIGRRHRANAFGHLCDVIPLPHPSGASTWFKMEPGKSLLRKALLELNEHPAWSALKKGVKK